MLSKYHHPLTMAFLILVLCISLANVNSVFADEVTPTEPPTATNEPTETPVAVTETPIATETSVEPTPTPVSATSTPMAAQDQPTEAPVSDEVPITELLSQVPENTDFVVLDESGDMVSLASQEAEEIVEAADPIWCPEGQLPTIGQNGCTNSFASIFDLLADMDANPANYAQNGVIYLENTKPSNPATTITSAVVIDNSTYSNLFTNLNIYNLTIQGGWNPNWNPNNPNSPMINGQTDFLGAGTYLQIGSSSNPWAGDVTLNDIKIGVTGANGGVGTNNGLTVYTTDGDISLNNVDVRQQEGNNYSAYLQSTNGDIILGGSLHLTGTQAHINTFDGNNSSGEQSLGFHAATTTGSISITDTRFQDAFQTGSSASANGANLSAPVITLTNVIAFDNDGNGIAISNANTVTLNNVTGGRNSQAMGNGLSGVFVNGNGQTVVNVSGGTFNFNGQYGVNLVNSILNEQAAPNCTGNGLATAAEPCYNTASIIPTSTPTNTPTNTPAVVPTNTPIPTSTATGLPPNSPTATPTNPAVTAPTKTPVSGTSAGPSNSSGDNTRPIPITSGGLINLDCLTTLNPFGITVTYYNLCDYRTSLRSVNATNLPGPLSDGTSFLLGLDVLVLKQGRNIDTLPYGAGIKMDFPLPTESPDQFAVLYWDDPDRDGEGEWIQISQEIESDAVLEVLSADPADELYRIAPTPADGNILKILTTEKTGTFILVRK